MGFGQVSRKAVLAFMLTVSTTGCLYNAGSGLIAGVLDESAGKGKSKGVNGVAQDLLEHETLAEMGHQLGAGLSAGP